MTTANNFLLEEINELEGIREYRLGNGAQLLLMPDPSKSKVTVNMTVFVGSRHEGYGEAGMAHLLEHMLFKGTPDHQDIPELLNNRGANFNGTTWLDRTNYYETLPAHTPELARENLEFALRLEADRLVNSTIDASEFASEMTVVSNEFERGENNPVHILRQRVYAAAYDWHGYGRSTIGNRSDIERVPVEKLREFYRHHYRPSNITVVVAGKFDEAIALGLAEHYFGSLTNPERTLDRTYTEEPAQDGERSVVLRRVGNAQHVIAAYHVPSGAHPDYAAVEMLAYMFGIEPSGRLYQSLVVPELASTVMTNALALHDPGLITFGCQVPQEKSLEQAKEALLHTIESVAEQPIEPAELERARSQFVRRRDLRAAKTERLAIELSEWAAQGDWRLYFYFRDAVERVTAEQCTEVAGRLLTRSNRTLGQFIPAETQVGVAIPTKPDLSQLLDGYQGRADVAAGEEFDPSPENIAQRMQCAVLESGVKAIWLPKKTRGSTVHIVLHLRYGNEESLTPLRFANDLYAQMLMRGTTQLDHQQIQDRLAELRSNIRISGSQGVLSVFLETKRDQLPKLLDLTRQILREPKFAPEELDIVRRQFVTAMEANQTEPNALAPLNVRRRLAPFSEDNIRYVPSIAERVRNGESVQAEQLHQIHGQLSGAVGEVAVVGDFEVEEVQSLFEEVLSNWNTETAFERIAHEAQTDVPGGLETITTPGKANAVYYACHHLEMREDHADYPALILANDVLGDSALASRLGNRVRGQEGLSYGIGSGLQAHSIDHRGTFMMYAITSPANQETLLNAIREEVELMQKDGITRKELEDSKQGLLQSRQMERTEDASLARLLTHNLFVGRSMEDVAKFESAVESLTMAEVHQAFGKHISLDHLVSAFAGDLG